ncbi:MAG: hypothetical protein R6V05_14060 [Candidatus Brocadiia bacterium]
MGKRRRRAAGIAIALVAAAAVAGVAFLGTGASRGESPTAEAAPASVIEQIEARESNAQTLHYEWVEQQEVDLGALPSWDPETERVGLPTGEGESLPRDMRFAVVVDGSQARTERSGPGANVVTRELEPDFQASVHLQTHTVRLDAEGQQVGRLVPQPSYWDLAVVPVIDAYRLLDPALGRADPAELVVAGRETFRGHPCLIIEQVQLSPDTGKGGGRWWLAEDMDYAVLKSQSLNQKEEVHGEAVLQYEPDPEVGWRLTSWEWPFCGSSWRTESRKLNKAQFNAPVDVNARYLP